MSVLPPGPAYLLRRLNILVIPPAFVISAAYAARHLYGVVVPLWLVLIGSLIAIPLTLVSNFVWWELQARRRARALGATWPQVVDLKKARMNSENKYYRDFFFRSREEHGNIFMLETFKLKRLFTTEPEHIKTILASDFSSFQKGKSWRMQMTSLLGVGVFNADDELWKFHRSMTRPFFSKDKISHFDIFDRHATDALRVMKARMRDGYAVDWQDLVSRFTLDSATEFLFGKDVHSLSSGLPYPPISGMARLHTTTSNSDEFATAFLHAQLTSSKRGTFQDLWPLFEFWHDKVGAQKSAIDDFIRPILQDALQKKAEKGSTPANEKAEEEETLLSHLIKITDDYNMIRDETVNILLAGRDTTACTLTFAVYNLAEKPDVLRRLREEVLNVVGPTRRPTYEDIRNMKYLRAVVNETLRLHPPVPGNVRAAVKDTVLPSTTPGGERTFVPAGMKVAYSVFIMHRRKDLWGPDALTFDPDRFLDERLHQYLTPNPFIFLPFNAGPRICLGQQFAYNEASFMLIRLLQQVSQIEFTPEVAPESLVPPGYNDSPGSNGTDRVWMASHLTMYAKGGLWVKMTETSAADDED